MPGDGATSDETGQRENESGGDAFPLRRGRAFKRRGIWGARCGVCGIEQVTDHANHRWALDELRRSGWTRHRVMGWLCPDGAGGPYFHFRAIWGRNYRPGDFLRPRDEREPGPENES